MTSRLALIGIALILCITACIDPKESEQRAREWALVHAKAADIMMIACDHNGSCLLHLLHNGATVPISITLLCERPPCRVYVP